MLKEEGEQKKFMCVGVNEKNQNKQTGAESETTDNNKLYLCQLINKIKINLYSGSLLHLSVSQ